MARSGSAISPRRATSLPRGCDGEDVFTAAIGGEYRPTERLALRAACESPLTDNEDLFGYRWTISAVWGF